MTDHSATPEDPRPISESLSALQRRAEEVHGAPIIPMPPTGIEAEVAAIWDERWRAIIPRRFWEAKLADFGTEVQQILTEWATTRPLPSLVITGPIVGTGKTHLAVAAARDWHRRGVRVMYTTAADLLSAMRPGGPEGTFRRAVDVDILILDDVAATRDTDWTDEMVFRMIDARWRAERPIIATTNLDLSELAARVGARVYERLCLSGAVLVQLGGQTRRRI